MTALHFVRLRSPEDGMYPKAMELYAVSFPRHEQREQPSQREIMGWGDYHFNLIYDGELFVGILLCWEARDFFYVEHFCIQPRLRGSRYGQRALELLKEGGGKPVILEIDPPVDEISKRRKAFYERAGFCENPYAHVHPPYHRDSRGHALTVMSCPAPLEQGEYDAFLRCLRQRVMGLNTP